MRRFRPENIVIIEAQSELGAGKRGASLGPKALRIRDLNKNGVFKGMKTISISSYDVLLNLKDDEFPKAKSIGHIFDFNRLLSVTIEKELEKGHFVILLSGDHSSAMGGVSGFRNSINHEECQLIWVDAHGDLHSPYTTPSGNMHGMPLAALMGIDNRKPDSILDPATSTQWDSLKSELSQGKFLTPEELLLIGIRDLESEEWDLIAKSNLRHLTAENFKTITDLSKNQTFNQWLKSKPTYISFDVDVMDPSISCGTGTQAANGFLKHHVVDLLHHLLDKCDTHVLEITEVNPLLDKKSCTIDLTLDILEALINK